LKRFDIPNRIDFDKQDQQHERKINGKARNAQRISWVAGNEQRVPDRAAK
jgi:hypothetical protein